MAPKKRTDGGKSTPPSSPNTSTFHAHVDHPHHHHLRHAGPSISTRARVSSKPPAERTPVSHLKDVEEEAEEENEGKKPKTAVAPRVGGSTKFARFVYTLALIAVALLLWYAYGMVTLLARLKDEFGWWGIVGSDSPTAWRGIYAWEEFLPRWAPSSGAGERVKDSLNELADALGVNPVEVASAVRPLVPQETLVRLVSTERTDASEAMKVLFEDTEQAGGGAQTIVREFAEEQVLD